MNEKETAMDRPMGNFAFRFMSFGYKFRDLRLPRVNILKEVGIKPGFSVLDYGCGPGGYITAVAQLVTGSGKVYALDIQPLAIKQVQNIAKKQKLANVEAILSDCATGLPDESIDVVLLYDILHGLSQPDEVLKELHRVLKLDGILSFHDHHIKEEKEVISKIAGKGLFQLSQKGARVYNFSKAK
jgi:ubiquinone/menaquinone biosynthesis C-methylase UbiE